MNKFALSLMLASALAASDARATDNKRPSAPANRCAAYGPGYVYAAQTRTCVKLNGRVRAEAITSGHAQEAATLRAEGRLQLDTHTQTGAGPLRTFIDVGGRTGRGRP